MSRIHQALSKAAQERAKQGNAGTAADMAEIAAAVRRIPDTLSVVKDLSPALYVLIGNSTPASTLLRLEQRTKPERNGFEP